MSRIFQHVLLVSACTETVDRLIELCELCDRPNLKISLARDLDTAYSLLESREHSVAILDLSLVDLDTLRHLAARLTPKPVVALIPQDSSTALRQALRAGADDVFLCSELFDNTDAFVTSMQRQISRAAYIEDAGRLRESLERSLDELRSDHHAAQHVQQNLLPPREQVINGLKFEYTLTPSLLLSGDFVDAIQINDHQTMFYLADVSGHGASSALVTVLLKNLTGRLVRNYRRHSSFDLLSPSATLNRINQEILLTRMGKHMTMFVGLLDNRNSTLTYAVGGHHPMPVLSTAGHAEFLQGRGMPVGLFEKPVFEEREIVLPEHFTLTLFSDGILETIAEPSLADKEALLLRKLKDGFVSSEQLTTELEFGAESHPDDVAIMTVSRA
ncbi:MAG: PP2C family protein-serine/threonine phosphatase [Nitrincola lacisaponensis]|uniref:Serine phosphatase RsbU, regulator of sigma subunit n=1 Tax=Nitrincola lacisaponensis TaxID=267850 RepID=A0A063Y1M5_9GAMM|nr:SpoIIE family protein phosphatase [Nitrincola lacisaponensis]KDE38676.1 Serine phosphatase RsbU, regulator of sigma subunit [Nitrincola lacisaponensis]